MYFSIALSATNGWTDYINTALYFVIADQEGGLIYSVYFSIALSATNEWTDYINTVLYFVIADQGGGLR